LSLTGLLRSAQQEHPAMLCQFIEVDAALPAGQLSDILQMNRDCWQDQQVCYKQHQRHIRYWDESAELTNKAPIFVPWKLGGVYLITGGLGGLGQIVATEIVQHVSEVTLVLLGRRDINDLDQSQQQTLNALEQRGATVQYHRVDISDFKALKVLIDQIQSTTTGLNGIVHSAGIIQDSLLANKSTDELLQVLAPKVDGTINLDEATAQMKLDFFVLFSSTAGALGNVGQSDYATANAFLDHFAEHRNSSVRQRHQRYGHTLALPTDAALRCMYHGLATKSTQLMVLSGHRDLLHQWLSNIQSRTVTKKTTVRQQRPNLKQHCLEQVTQLFSEVTELATDVVDVHEPLESYGIDSILITQLNQKLELAFTDIPQTLFYEYKTLQAVSEYLLKEKHDEVMLWLEIDVETPPEENGSEIPLLASLEVNRANEKVESFGDDDIAIIGLSGRFPQAENLEQYWDKLYRGETCFTEIPERRWPWSDFYQADMDKAIEQARSYCRLGGFIDDFDQFDPLFFNISPVDVFNIDPQERLMLMTCWQAVEDSGYSRQSLQERYQGSVGVFIGATKLGFNLHTRLQPGDDAYLPQTSFSSMANRVSYQLDLNGPSMAIDTMCASSLTALHEACEHIRSGECSMAIAGAVNLYLHPRTYVDLCQGKLLTDKPQIDCFSESGQGFIPGEGVCAAVLKPMSQAIVDGDHIYGVIKGSSVNHSGRTHGYSVPSVEQQRKVIEKAMQRAGCEARDIGMVEAAANGSSMGDAIELQVLQQVFRNCDAQSCYLGSVHL